jgi:dTDP-4-amino-4,6-dideoxygalactose transaminase
MRRAIALFAGAGVSEVVLPVEAPNRNHIYNQFVIRVPQRDQLRAHLDAARIGTEVYYPVPFHLQECFAIWATSRALSRSPRPRPTIRWRCRSIRN